ncbi:MAG: DUF2442 domain-containing protein [Candidatus Kapabacteria bacterium]|nr:DUF2442 domain-containing protein [Candidatus Kapabacteria bacterium]
MNPRVKEAKAIDDYNLEIVFTNNEVKVFDTKPYLNIGIFNELKDNSKFKKVKAFLESIQWEGGQDLCPDTLYLDSKKV